MKHVFVAVNEVALCVRCRPRIGSTAFASRNRVLPTHLPAVPPHTHIMTSSMGTLTALRGNLMLKGGVVTPESAADKDIIQSVGL